MRTIHLVFAILLLQTSFAQKSYLLEGKSKKVKLYNENIRIADSLFDNELFLESIPYYKKANEIFPDQGHPQDRLQQAPVAANDLKRTGHLFNDRDRERLRLQRIEEDKNRLNLFLKKKESFDYVSEGIYNEYNNGRLSINAENINKLKKLFYHLMITSCKDYESFYDDYQWAKYNNLLSNDAFKIELYDSNDRRNALIRISEKLVKIENADAGFDLDNFIFYRKHEFAVSEQYRNPEYREQYNDLTAEKDYEKIRIKQDLSNNELEKMLANFKKLLEPGKTLAALNLLIINNPGNTEYAKNFIEYFISFNKREMYDKTKKVYANLFNLIIQEHKSDVSLMNKLAKKMIEKGDYLEAEQKILSKLVDNEETNELMFITKIHTESLTNGFDYALNNKIRYYKLNEILINEKVYLIVSGSKKYELIKYLYNKYPKSHDSLNYAILEGFKDNGDCVCNSVSIGFDSIQQIVKIYSALGYKDEAMILEEEFWDNYEIDNPEEYITLYNQGKIKNKIYVGEKLKFIGWEWFDEASHPGRNGVNRNLQRTSLNLLLKAVKFIPQDAELYKLIGHAYFLSGNSAAAQPYYIKASKMGANMGDVGAYGGGKNIKTGSRGGKYYINSNGNKTYVPK